MTEEAKEARRAYKRAWYAANRDKVRAYVSAYWERKAQAMSTGSTPEGGTATDTREKAARSRAEPL